MVPDRNERFASTRPFPEGTTTTHFNEDVGYVATETANGERIEYQLSAEDVNRLRNILEWMRVPKN